MSNGECLKSEAEVEDCEFYSAEGVCSGCITDKFLNRDVNQCLAFPKAVGCIVYNSLRCDECKYGFTQDLNFYMRWSVTIHQTQGFALSITDQSQISESLDENCFPLNVANCRVHETADSCLECDPGFFVTDHRKCQAYPHNQVQNCRVYSDLTTCFECDWLYLLDGNICIRRTLVAGCAEYNRIKEGCVKCVEGLYSTSASCVELTSVAFCKTYAAGADACETCAETHLLDSAGTCLEKVESCATFELDVTSPNHNKCTRCSDDYFLEDDLPASECVQRKHQAFCQEVEEYKNACKTCAPGYFNRDGACSPYTVDFCEERDPNADECETCIEGFEKVDRVCRVIELNNCKESSTTSGQCDTCVEGFYRDSSKTCRMRNLIGCSIPTPYKNECTTCEDGYERDVSDNLCYVINEPNCVSGSFRQGTCTACVVGYELTEFGTCYINQINLANCSGANDTITCTACDDPDTHYLEPVTNYCVPRTKTSCASYDAYSDLCTSCTLGNFLHGGRCEAVTVTCDSFVPGRNECATCPTDYYLDSVSKTCLKNFTNNCAIQSDNDAFGCKTCNNQYHLNPETRLCEKGYLPHCDTYSDSTTCSVCETGSYKLNGRCYKNFDLGCETTVATPTASSQCSKCFPGFVLVSGICRLASLSNCVEYTTTGDCARCIDDWYLKSPTDCAKKYVARCLEYTPGSASGSNTCAKCESMYYGPTCSRITALNCVNSNGVDDACSTCAPGYKVNDSACDLITNSFAIYDPHCLGNDTSHDSTCTVCKDNFSVMFLYEFHFEKTSCGDFDEHLIYPCEDGFQLTPDFACEPVTVQTTCLQSAFDFTEGLEAANQLGACEKCSDYQTHFLDNFTCLERKVVYGCETYSEGSDECFTCQDNLNSRVSSVSRVSCVEATAVTINSNCAVFDQLTLTNSLCKYCKMGFAGSNCDPSVLDFFGKSPVGDLGTLATDASSSFDSMVPAFKANTALSRGGKVKKASVFIEIDPSNKIHSVYNQINGSYEPGSVNPNAALVTVDNGNTWLNGTPISGCVLGIIKSLTIYCLACPDGKVGKTWTTLQNNMTPITECVDPAPLGLLKKYSGMGYVNDTITLTSQTNLDRAGDKFYVTFDSCSDDNTLVVYLYKNTGDITNLLPHNYSNMSTPYQCVKEVLDDNKVENCHVYGYAGSTFGSTPDLSSKYEPLSACLSCKPGYAGTLPAGSGELLFLYRECTPIENCDLQSPENTMMNACNKCKPGYAWDVDPASFRVLMLKCVKASDYCVVYNSTSSQCRICEAGYSLSEKNTCTKITDLYCTSQGVQMPDFLNLDLASETNTDVIFGYLTHFYIAKRVSNNNTSMFCETCKSGFIPVVDDTPDSRDYCVYDETQNLEGCLKYHAVPVSSMCSQCADNYALDLTSGTWHDLNLVEGAEHCLEFDGSFSDLPKCTKCREGFSQNFRTSECSYNPHCTRLNKFQEYCRGCAEGYYLDNAERLCHKTPEDSECAELYLDDFDGTDVFLCMACKDETKVPIHYDIRITGELDQFRCVPNVYGFPSYFESLVAQGNFQWRHGAGLLIFSGDDPNPPDSSLVPNTEQGGLAICVPRFGNHLFCEDFDNINHVCLECYHKYYLHQGTCYKGQIPLCVEYADTPDADYFKKQTCKRCESTAYISTVSEKNDPDLTYTNQCVLYTKVCDKYDKDSDNCLSCLPYYYLEVSTGAPVTTDCKPYTVVNCQVFMPSNNKCLVCSSGYFMDSTNLCQPITVSNCARFSYNADECTLCDEGFYLTFGGRCTPHSVWNCKVYSQHKDQCELCTRGHYLTEQGRCKQNFLQGCRVHESNRPKCSLCKQGYYMDVAESLCKKHTVYHCSVFDQLANKCVSCDDSSYMDTNDKCVEYSTALNCRTFDSREDKCVNCLAGFYLDSLSICRRYSTNTCKSYNNYKDECTSCHKSFYLDTTNICRPVTSTNCAEFSVSSDRCSLCPESYYLDLTSGDCLFYTVQNCSQYHPYKDHCATCKEGHYININMNCKEYTASGCSSYSVNSDSCVSCQSGYYLNISTKQCHPYTVTDCVSYRLQENKCASCLPGFYLSNGLCKWYTVSNCSKNDSSADRCLGCIPGYYFFGGRCLAYTVKNCRKFDHESNKCVSCLDGHFFEFGECFEYTAKYCKTYNPYKDLCIDCDNTSSLVYMNTDTNSCEKVTPINHCQTYHTNQNQCQACTEGYFLNGEYQCQPNPDGIPNCEHYRDHHTCRQCHPGYFLRSNSCLAPTPIPRCKRYSSADYCEECESDSALTSDFQCKRKVYTSCATWTDFQNCATCSGNQVLEQNVSKHKVCVSSGIDFCEEAVKIPTGIICVKCETGYFLDEDQTQCLWPETLVEHCREYSDHGVCARCLDNYLLSKNNKHCTSDITTVGRNCLSGHVSDRPKCSRCAGGYYFDDTGVCQKCSQNIEGCALCDIENLSRCLICASGYFMNEEFTCEEYPVDPGLPVGVGIHGVMIGVLVWVFLSN